MAVLLYQPKQKSNQQTLLKVSVMLLMITKQWVKPVVM